MTIPKLNVREVAPGEDAEAIYLNSLTDQHVVRVYLEFFSAILGIPPLIPSWLSWCGSGTASPRAVNTV